jgi:hypothetical protein
MQSSIFKGLFGFAIVVALLAGLGQPADAQVDARRKAEEALRSGIQAQGRRDHRSALQFFSQAINSSALGRSELAVALYRRAISYRGQKQPARAISDINSALFFKDALPSKDRANAIEVRLQAYRDAGLKAPALATSTPRAPSSAALQAPSGPVRSGPRIINTAPRRVSGPVRRVAPRQSRSDLPPTAPILGGTTSGSPVAVRPPQPAAPQISAFSTETRRGAPQPSSVPTFTTRAAPAPSSVASVRSRPAVTPRGSWSTETSSRPSRVTTTTTSAAAQAGTLGTYATRSGGAVTSSVAAPQVAAPTAWRGSTPTVRQPAVETPSARSVSRPREVASASAPARTSSNGQGIGGFFSNLFGQSQSRDAIVPETTSSVPRREPTPRVQPSRERVAAVVPPAAPQAAAKPRAPRAKGFDIELAALSDRFRAEAIAQQVMVQYSSDFYWSSRKTRIDERAGPEGNTIYAVRLGLYGDEASARDFCGKLEADGFDCNIVVRR